jgi:hypothetical protein
MKEITQRDAILTLYGFVFLYNLVLLYSRKNSNEENFNVIEDID